MNNYEDIIVLKRPISKYPKMSLEQRSSIFSSFDCLKGYKDDLKEKERITLDKIILSEEKKEIINYKLHEVYTSSSEAEFIYYIKDSKKNGYNYKSIIGTIKKIDLIQKEIVFTSNKKIPINNIIDINICYN